MKTGGKLEAAVAAGPPTPAGRRGAAALTALAAALLAVLVLLAGCGGARQPAAAAKPSTGIDGTAQLAGRFGRLPFGGAHILVHEVGTRHLRRLTADAEGRFVLPLPPGGYTLTAVYRRQPGSAVRVLVPAAGYAHVRLTQTVNGRSLGAPPLAAPAASGSLALLDGYAELIGRWGHKAWEGAHVLVRPMAGGPKRRVTAGTDGHFILALPPGRYIVHAGFLGSRNGIKTVRLHARRVGFVRLSVLVNMAGGEFRDATALLPHKHSSQ